MLNDKHLEDSEEANIVDGEDLDVAVAEMAMEHELLHLYHGTTLLARDQAFWAYPWLVYRWAERPDQRIDLGEVTSTEAEAIVLAEGHKSVLNPALFSVHDIASRWVSGWEMLTAIALDVYPQLQRLLDYGKDYDTPLPIWLLLDHYGVGYSGISDGHLYSLFKGCKDVAAMTFSEGVRSGHSARSNKSTTKVKVKVDLIKPAEPCIKILFILHQSRLDELTNLSWLVRALESWTTVAFAFGTDDMILSRDFEWMYRSPNPPYRFSTPGPPFPPSAYTAFGPLGW